MSLTISRVLHAGYIFDASESDDDRNHRTKIIFDPIFENPFSNNCYAYPSVKFDLDQIGKLNFSAVFISHYHDDHCSFESLALLDRSTPIYIHCIHEELFDLLRELGFTEVHQLVFDRTVKIGAFEITPRKPFDSDVDSMLQIRHGDLNILNVVDSVMDPKTLELLKQQAPWDLVLWPFQTMLETAVLTPSRQGETHVDETLADWIEDLRVLNPRLLVPSACQFQQEPWSWYNRAMFPITYQKFEAVMSSALPNAKVVRMNPGTTFKLGNQLTPSTQLSWVLPVGPQDVDYDYQPNISAPSTAEVAPHFPALTPEETNRVLSFCQSELLTRHQALEPTEYFSKLRHWRLSLFDQAGHCTAFDYEILNSSITLISSHADDAHTANARLAWSTEVPIAKLYAALEKGEVLTSMYMRVNDQKFSAEIESDLLGFDVLEDPLIRTLFRGDFAAYQRDQLVRLRSSSFIHRLTTPIIEHV